MPIAHLGHGELYVDDLAAARHYYTEVLGLTCSDEDQTALYLRAWQDWEHHTLIIRKGAGRGLGHISWRVSTPEGLEEYARLFEARAIPHTWLPKGHELGQGEALRFSTPQGLPMELYWEMVTWRATDPARSSVYPSFPEKFPYRGVAPRRIDHANIMVNDVAAEQQWISEVLGIKHRYYVERSDGKRQGSWLSVTNLSHDIAVMHNEHQDGGKLHHQAYYLDSPDELLRAATIIAQHGGRLEWGPGRHATSGATFLYFFDPSGNRLELWTGGMLIFPPDWQALRWNPEIGREGFDMWGTRPPASYLSYGSPPVTATRQYEEGDGVA